MTMVRNRHGTRREAAGGLAATALTFALGRPARARSPLALEVFTAGEAGYGVTSTIIYGPTEAIVVDAQFRVADAEQLAARIDALGRRVTAIFVTHADTDHIVGLGLLHARYPQAPIYMTRAGLTDYRANIAGVREQFLGGPRAAEAPAAEPLAKPLDAQRLTVDGAVVELIPDLQGDAPGIASNTALWIPSLRALVAGDMAFDRVHLWLDKSTPAVRLAWRAGLDRLAALRPAVVVAGHKQDPTAADSPAVLAMTRDYLIDFDQDLAANPDAAAFTEAMTRRRADWAHPLFLKIAAKSVYQGR